MPPKRLTKEDYTVAWICALPVPELKASRLLFDEEHQDVVLEQHTSHQYIYGTVNTHNVVMGCCPASQMGKASAASVASEMSTTFPNLRFALLVGIAGAVPSPLDIRLGDVVVGCPDLGRRHTGVVQYDFGKAISDGSFLETGQLNQPPTILLSAVGKVRSAPSPQSHFPRYLQIYREDLYWRPGLDDRLFETTYNHVEGQRTCNKCDPDAVKVRQERSSDVPYVHYGLIASGDQVMKDAAKRDAISQRYGEVLCFEMEAAGISNNLPCLVIRGMCDYCDSHKNKAWQPFAAAAAAAWAKELLRNVNPGQIRDQDTRVQWIGARNGREAWMERFAGQLTTMKRSGETVEGLIFRISPYEPRRILERISRKRLEGTTEWLINASEFNQWQYGDGNSNLWISGKVGSGKTVAMTAAVSNLLSTFKQRHHSKVLHYFFQYPNIQAIDLFRSFSKQLLEHYIKMDLECPQELIQDLETFFRDDNMSPDLDEVIEATFLPLTDAIGTLIVCIDGVNMCDEHQQSKACKGLRLLSHHRKSLHKITKIIITSENDSKISEFFYNEDFRLRLDQELISTDIEKYIDARLQQRASKGQLFEDSNLRDRVKKVLASEANDMFLWVHFQMEELLHNCSTPSEVVSALEDLPKSLSDVYMQCLKRRLDQRLLCNPKVLKWCSAAKIPLRIDEVRDMLALDWESGDVHAAKRPDEKSVIRSGVSLLTFEEIDQVLIPAHHSIRQFIFSTSTWNCIATDQDFPQSAREEFAASAEDTEREIGQLCLSHIKAKTGLEVQSRRTVDAPPVVGMIPWIVQQAFGFSQPDRMVVKLPLHIPLGRHENAAFLSYARKAWLLHTTRFTADTTAWDLFRDVALQPNASWKLHPWLAVGNTQLSHLRGLLGYAVAHNHAPLLQILVDEPSLLPRGIYDEVLPGNSLLPALHIAAKFNHVDLIPMLLKVCSVNAKCPLHRRTALHIAAFHGHEHFVTLLCRFRDTKADTLDIHGLSPSDLAKQNGHLQAFEALAKFTYRSPLEAKEIPEGLREACRNGNEGWIRTIVTTFQVDVNLGSEDGQTLLHCAATFGQAPIAQFLLARGANPSAIDTSRRTPLHTAAGFGHERIVKLLLDTHDVNVDTKDKLGRTALRDAAIGGYEGITKILLAAGANFTVADDLNKTALHYAAFKGHEGTVKILLDVGADVNLADDHGYTALHEAASRGHEGALKILLAAGADMNLTALPPARYRGNRGILPVNLADDHGYTALHEAASRGHEGALKILLAAGADMNLTALPPARYRGNRGILPTLLDDETDIDSMDARGWTPLFYAAEKGHTMVVKALLEAGADASARDHAGRSPLGIAREIENEGVIRLLVQAKKHEMYRSRRGQYISK